MCSKDKTDTSNLHGVCQAFPFLHNDQNLFHAAFAGLSGAKVPGLVMSALIQCLPTWNSKCLLPFAENGLPP